MEEENYVVGLDIGASKVSAAVGEIQSDGSLKIVGFHEKSVFPEDEAIKNGEIENAKRTTELIDEVLQELSDNLDFNLESVNVNYANPDISGHSHKGKVTKSGDNKQIQQADVDKLINDVRVTFKAQPGRVVLHCMPQDFYVNDVKAGEKVVGKFGVQIGGDFYFLTSKNESLSNYYYTLKNVTPKSNAAKLPHIEVDNLLLSPVADAFSVLDHTIDDKRNGVAIVNVGADLTEICIFHKNGLRYFKAIPIAGNHITQDLRDAFHINYEEAEVLKKICGNLPSASISENEVAVIERKNDLASIEVLLKNASLVVEWRLKEIAAIIKSEITRSGFDGLLTNGIILTGGTASMGIAKDVFVEVCKIKSVRRAKISSKIDLNGFEMLRRPKYSTLLGLLLASNQEFDSRMSNHILKHATVVEPQVEKFEKPETNSAKKDKDIKPPKRPLFERIKVMLTDEKDPMNDIY